MKKKPAQPRSKLIGQTSAGQTFRLKKGTKRGLVVVRKRKPPFRPGITPERVVQLLAAEGQVVRLSTEVSSLKALNEDLLEQKNDACDALALEQKNTEAQKEALAAIERQNEALTNGSQDLRKALEIEQGVTERIRSENERLKNEKVDLGIKLNNATAELHKLKSIPASYPRTDAYSRVKV